MIVIIYKRLGNTEIEVSVVALGCWAFGGDAMWGQQNDEDSIAAVNTALDKGINFFDTAEAYGNSEKVLGKALLGKREGLVIATKPVPGRMTKEEIIKACEDSLERLQTDYIDLYQIHWPNHTIPFEETMEGLLRLKEQGKIRAVGVCNFGNSDLNGILKAGRIETNQISYNLIWRAIEYSIQETCIKNDVGIMCYSPLMHGILTGKYHTADDVPDSRARTKHFSQSRTPNGAGFEEETFEAINRIRKISKECGISMSYLSVLWLLHQKGIVSVLAGGRNSEQVKENADIIKMKITEDVIRELTLATDSLKEKLGPNADMWRNRIT